MLSDAPIHHLSLILIFLFWSFCLIHIVHPLYCSTGINQLYELSYLYYTAVGVVVTVVMGVIVSFITGLSIYHDIVYTLKKNNRQIVNK